MQDNFLKSKLQLFIRNWKKIITFAVPKVWGISSVGRALGSQSRGREFDPPMLHSKAADFQRLILYHLFRDKYGIIVWKQQVISAISAANIQRLRYVLGRHCHPYEYNLGQNIQLFPRFGPITGITNPRIRCRLYDFCAWIPSRQMMSRKPHRLNVSVYGQMSYAGHRYAL